MSAIAIDLRTALALERLGDEAVAIVRGGPQVVDVSALVERVTKAVRAVRYAFVPDEGSPAPLEVETVFDACDAPPTRPGNVVRVSDGVPMARAVSPDAWRLTEAGREQIARDCTR